MLISFKYFLWVENFNPVAIRVHDEGNTLQTSIIWSLLKLHIQRIKVLARLLKIRYSDPDVSETLRIRVPVVV